MGAYGPPPGFYHNTRGVRIDPRYCTACMRCLKVCPQKGVLAIVGGKENPKVAVKDVNKCVGCARCVESCLTNAIGLYFI